MARAGRRGNPDRLSFLKKVRICADTVKGVGMLEIWSKWLPGSWGRMELIEVRVDTDLGREGWDGGASERFCFLGQGYLSCFG